LQNWLFMLCLKWVQHFFTLTLLRRCMCCLKVNFFEFKAYDCEWGDSCWQVFLSCCYYLYAQLLPILQIPLILHPQTPISLNGFNVSSLNEFHKPVRLWKISYIFHSFGDKWVLLLFLYFFHLVSSFSIILSLNYNMILYKSFWKNDWTHI